MYFPLLRLERRLPIMSAVADSEVKTEVDVHHQDVREAEKLGVEVDEVVVTRISEEDMMQISRDCLDFHSRTGYHIVLITLVMGFNMAGFVTPRHVTKLARPLLTRTAPAMVWTGVSYLA